MKIQATLIAILAFVVVPAEAQSPLDTLTEADIADGERLFRLHCARCHGIDGAGGEGSNLVRAKLKYAPDDESLIEVMGEGIPGTGMPAFWTLDEKQATRVAGYVRTLGRLEAKGFVQSSVSEPTAERGGRRKKLYEVSPTGLVAIQNSLADLRRLTSGLDLEPEKP